MKREFKVNLNIDDTVKVIRKYIEKGSVTGELVNERVISIEDKKVITLIFVKHFWRASNHLTLTVTIDDAEGFVRVYSVGSGGGQGLFKFDWGAAESFADEVEYALKNYIIK